MELGHNIILKSYQSNKDAISCDWGYSIFPVIDICNHDDRFENVRAIRILFDMNA